MLQALSDTMGQLFFGEHRDRVVRLAEGQPPDVIDRLVKRARAHAGTKMRDKAIADLEACAHAPRLGADPDKVARRRENLRSLIATFAESDPDHAQGLRQELADLE